MRQFLYLFRGGDSGSSPEEMQESMQKWAKWIEDLSKEGKFVSGLPLDQEGKVLEGNSRVLTDGPFTEGKEVVGGYSIVNAENLDEAVELTKGCPIFETGGSVEIRKLLSMEME